MKIAYITDLHADEGFTLDNGKDPRKNWEVILEDVEKRGLSHLIYGGDIGDPKCNEWFFDSLKGFELDITLGNHDLFEVASRYFDPGLPAGQNGMYYSKEVGNYRFIFLDSSTGEIHSEQLGWLESALQTEKKVCVFMHHPVLHTGTTPQREFPWKSPEGVRDVLKGSSKEITLYCAHLHLEHETVEGNIRQLITPSASIQIKPDSEKTEIDPTDKFAYRILTVQDDQVSCELVWF